MGEADTVAEVWARILAGERYPHNYIVKEVFRHVLTTGEVRTEALATTLNMPMRTVRYHIRGLVERGILIKRRRKIHDDYWYYELSPDLVFAVQKLFHILRKRGGA